MAILSGRIQQPTISLNWLKFRILFKDISLMIWANNWITSGASIAKRLDIFEKLAKETAHSKF